LRIQLWSYNYAPEPTGIGPVSTVLARGLAERGHEVEVVAAHPHYPSPIWGTRLTPYREIRDGIPVLRLPLWIGKASAAERYRQELTFMAAQLAAAPLLRRPDVLVSASPSFPALLPAGLYARIRRVPWVIWLHDILPDGAAATGLVNDGAILSAARKLERTAYGKADRIVVLSSAFTRNLVGKGVPESKIRLIFDPATRVPETASNGHGHGDTSPQPCRLLSMGNIGYSQGLAPLVGAFEQSSALSDTPVKLAITGNGVAAEDVRREIVTDRVEMLGVVDDASLEEQLQQASVALVTQHHEGAEFNIPSKLMNFMAYGLPVLAAVNPAGEVARIIGESGAGWVVDSSRPEAFPTAVKEILAAPHEIARRREAARRYAQDHFSPEGFTARFDEMLREVVARSR
jgi:colanic acid biosynthesis glycosyl transferase WcaI